MGCNQSKDTVKQNEPLDFTDGRQIKANEVTLPLAVDTNTNRSRVSSVVERNNGDNNQRIVSQKSSIADKNNKDNNNNARDRSSSAGRLSAVGGGTKSELALSEVPGDHNAASISFIVTALRKSAVVRSAIESWNLSDDDLNKIAGRAKLLKIGSNEYSLPIEHRLYIVKSGSLAAQENGPNSHPRVVGVGGIVNDFGVIHFKDRSTLSDIQANRKSRVYMIESKDFHQVVLHRTARSSFTIHSASMKLPLNDRQREELEENSLTFITGDILMKKGAKSDGIYIILEGFVQAQTEPLKPTKSATGQQVLGQGDIFGDSSICLGTDEPARITALTDGLAGFISVEELNKLEYDELFEYVERRCLKKQESTSPSGKRRPRNELERKEILMSRHVYDYDTDEESPAYRSSCNIFEINFSWLVGDD